METAGVKKYIKISPEISIIACAATRVVNIPEVLSNDPDFDDYLQKPNQFWDKDRHHERAWLKIYSNPEQTVIPMPFLGKNSEDGWAELQLRVKRRVRRYGATVHLRPVKIGRHRSFDTRIGESGEWRNETTPIEPKRDNQSHYFLPFRVYHQDHLPEKMHGGWHWEPVYIAIANKEFYRIDVLWEKEEIAITVTPLNPDSSEIPEHIRGATKAAQEELASILRRSR